MLASPRPQPQQVNTWIALLGVIAGALLVAFLFSASVNAQSSDSTFTVDSTADDADVSLGDGTCTTANAECTLRAAIEEANLHTGPDKIAFNIPGDGVQTVQLSEELPWLSDRSGPTTIDGYSQPGSSPNTNSFASNAVIKMEIKGGHDPATGAFNGLTISSPGNVVRGLALYSLNKPISLLRSGAHDNHIPGNFVDTNAAGTYSAPYVQHGNGVHGIGGAASNTIGGVSAAECNVISGNADNGVAFYGPGTDSNVVVGNLIGLSPTGSKRLSNNNHGVDINVGASYNVIGGDISPGEGNVISGNGTHGVEVSHKGLTDPSRPEYPTGNQVVGNFIGTDVTGKRDPGYSYNDSRGVVVEDGAKSTVVRENVIGNNKGYGIYIRNHDTTDTLVYDNRIGVSRSGAAVSNGFAGVRIEAGANRSRIGPDNVIANNPVGIRISDAESDSNTITRNSIYRNDELGIDLEPIETVNASDPGDADTGANQQLNSPVLTSALKRADRPAVIRGTACAGCTVEVFRADTDARTYGEGKTFVGSAVSDADGAFVVNVRVGRGRYVTATATDTEGNTSEFSRNLVVSRN